MFRLSRRGRRNRMRADRFHATESGEPRLAEPIPCRSWTDLSAWFERRQEQWDAESWVFRGQRSSGLAALQLTTSLERALHRFGLPLAEAPAWEYRILRDFKRRCHLATTPPSMDSDLEWLALLRHYGGPARLLDWTYSFWTAIYFALEGARPGQICDIWALDAGWWRVRSLYPRLQRVVEKHGPNSAEENHEVLTCKQRPGVWFLRPFRLNDRLSAQQGSFMLPLDITTSLVGNLAALAPYRERSRHVELHQMRVTTELLTTCLSQLQRMNISAITLYPGLTGLARHYDNALAMPRLFGEGGRTSRR